MNASDVVRICVTLAVFPANTDKAPFTDNGFKDASRDPAVIAGWWNQWPGALVAMPTGAVNGFIVIDVDPEGLEWYQRNRDRLGCRFTVKTRRGTHLYYRVPDFEVRCSTGKLAVGVDVRAEGGYVVAWWAHGHAVAGTLDAIGPAPDWLLESLAGLERSSDFAEPVVGTIGEGLRNVALTSLAGSMRDRGCEADEIMALLRAANARRCSPPLGERELIAIVRSVMRYAPGSAWWAVNDAEDAAAEAWMLER